MMNYSQAIDYIHSHRAHSVDPGLHRIEALLGQLGNPQKGLLFLHIAGTNGKGSTATMLASVLQKAGYKTGLYTSPFIYDFRERFAVNGQIISREKLAELAEQVKTAADRLILAGMERPTEFEIVTAIGFLFFKDAGCDITVLEVGLGGRLDATNVIQAPLASVICSLSMDHTEFLGSTIESVAYEKAGIIKYGCPVVVYNRIPEEAYTVILGRCNDQKAHLIQGGEAEILSSDIKGNRFIYKGREYTVSLRGPHQVNNAITVIETLELIKDRFPYTEEDLKSGLKEAYIPSRLDCIHKDPCVFIDGGHNREGIDSLLRAMDTMEELKDPVIIFAMMRDKPYQYAVQRLALRARAFLAVEPPLPRAVKAYDLKNMADLFCDDCTACSSYEEAARLAKEKGGTVLVAGSLYMAGEMAMELKKLV
ncbi:MAG: bifunctional folylpolyglutamate synthase/dihydrofolate synthase [Clostridia bacterium]|nr:bifunctional folylpolyglutamate synthase/dihydrofolate synthase [Clostridia bacterium]